MRELSLHIMDIAENSVSAQASRITISVKEDYLSDRLIITVEDDGVGMDAETAYRVIDPFMTSRTTRNVGLGIPLLKGAAELCDGDLKIYSSPGMGTVIDVDFQRSHLDRMPLGDLSSTCLTLLVAHPDIHWIFNYTVVSPGNQITEFIFDDAPIKETLDGVPLSNPLVLNYLRGLFEEGIREPEISD